MVFKYLVVALIPAIASGDIKVTVKAGENEANSSVQFTGENTEIISDKERKTFHIEDGDLKEACKEFSGGRPDSVYVREPTPWGVYHKYNWPQVERILKPVKAKILGIHTKPVIVSTQEFENHSKVKVKYQAGVSQAVQETVSQSWTTGGQLTVGQEIRYNVEFGFGDVGGSTSLSYAQSWGSGNSKSQSVTLGSTTGVEVELEPGQAVMATLTANYGTLDIEIDYEAYLTGSVFANYGHVYRGHHFWDYPVDNLLKAGKHPTTVKSTEKISVGFYSSARVDVTDRVTKTLLKSAPAAIRINVDQVKK